MPKGICCVDGCGRKTACKGMCAMHYERVKRDGVPGEASPRQGTNKGKICKISGCCSPAKYKGLCSRHYQRLLNHGDPLGGGKDRQKIGDLYRSPTYWSWVGMLARCKNQNNKAYKHYGGRGIKVCKSWENIINFVADMGLRPTGTTLDRIDVDKDYCPENCRWANPWEQTTNRRNSREESCVFYREDCPAKPWRLGITQKDSKRHEYGFVTKEEAIFMRDNIVKEKYFNN